jgi:hypothetical protein
MDQAQLTELLCERPQNFTWFLGAGASRSAGLPTASDVLWIMKRRYYSTEENQDISRQDIQNEAIRARIQSYMESRGFPKEWADDEYPAYFEKIFGDDRERQRRYIRTILSEEKVKLTIGHRALSEAACTVLSTSPKELEPGNSDGKRREILCQSHCQCDWRGPSGCRSSLLDP